MSNKQSIRSWRPVATVFLLFALLLTPLSAFAAEMLPDGTVSGSELSGTLTNSNTRHYLGLEPSERDGEITLTLTFGPQSNGEIASRVNFWVLSQSALESTLTGTVDYGQVDLAAGSPISGKNDDYKVQATFKASGKDHYTVIVYSKAPVSADYTLTASNGILSDGSGQTHVMSSEQMVEAQAVVTTDASSASMSDMMSNDAVSNSKKVSASIGAQERFYYTVVPVDNDEDVSFTFDYDPKDNSLLDGNINFFVFDNDGLRRMDNGERPESANLAAGNVVKSGESKLNASFRAVGKQSYVVMVINRSDVPATFTLDLSGGDFQ